MLGLLLGGKNMKRKVQGVNPCLAKDNPLLKEDFTEGMTFEESLSLDELASFHSLGNEPKTQIDSTKAKNNPLLDEDYND